MPINDISSIFSQNTTAAKKKLEDIEANKPGQYHSNWNGTINSLMDKIVNQKDCTSSIRISIHSLENRRHLIRRQMRRH